MAFARTRIGARTPRLTPIVRRSFVRTFRSDVIRGVVFVNETEEPRPTHRQNEYLVFIQRYIEVHRQPPSEADIARHFRVSAPAVHQMILALEAGGFLARKPGKARAIQLLASPIEHNHRERSGSRSDPTPPTTGEDDSAVVAVICVGTEMLRLLFEHNDRFPIDDAELAPLVRCMLDGVDAGLRAAGARPSVAREARDRLLQEALRTYTSWCARNDSSGADTKEDGKTFLYLMKHGRWPKT